MAELAGAGELHEVDDAEADAVFEDCKHAIPHNEMLGRLIRNMYGALASFGKRSCSPKEG